VAAQFPSIVFGLSPQTEQVPGVTHKLLRNRAICGVGRKQVEDALHLIDTTDEFRVESPLALKVLYALL